MNTLSAHLAKDWHEQRRGIVALLVLAAALPLVTWSLPDHVWPATAPLGEVAALLVLAAAAVLLACDLVPREVAGEARGLALLARLPRGLSRALSSKALLYIVGVGATTLTAYCVGRTLDAWRGSYDPRSWEFVSETVVLFAAVTLPWLFAASTFVSRGSWTLPVALFTTWPAWIAALVAHSEASGAVGGALVLVLNASAAFATAHVTFVGGHAAGRSQRAVVGRGTLAIALIATLFGGYAVLGVRNSITVDPTHEGFRIREFAVDETGERLWMLGYRQPDRPNYSSAPANGRVLTASVVGGEWEFRGGAGTSFAEVGPPDWLSLHSADSPILVRESNANTTPRFFDPTSARPIDIDVASAAVRSDFEWPSGNWDRYGNARVEHSVDRMAKSTRVTDPTTGVSLLQSDVADEQGRPCRMLFVRDGSWVVQRHDLALELLDPLTGSRRRAPPGLSSRNLGPFMLADGHFLGVDADDRIAAVDPDAPHLAETIPGLEKRFEHAAVRHVDHVGTPERAALPRLVSLTDADRTRQHARLLAGPTRFEGTIEQVGANVLNVVWLDEDRLLFLEDWRRIVELDFARGTRRVVFPR